jgi:hypothetical protein
VSDKISHWSDEGIASGAGTRRRGRISVDTNQDRGGARLGAVHLDLAQQLIQRG